MSLLFTAICGWHVPNFIYISFSNTIWNRGNTFMNYSIIINESFVEISRFFIFLYIVDNIISTLDKIRKICKSYLFNFYNDNSNIYCLYINKHFENSSSYILIRDWHLYCIWLTFSNTQFKILSRNSKVYQSANSSMICDEDLLWNIMVAFIVDQ